MKRLFIGCLLCMSLPAIAAPIPPVDPLLVAVRTVWEPDVRTVEDATRWLLEPIGYHIQSDFPAPTATRTLLAKSIPPSLKLHRTMPVMDVLQLLIGTDNTVIVDRANQLIAFEKGQQRQ